MHLTITVLELLSFYQNARDNWKLNNNEMHRNDPFLPSIKGVLGY